MTVGSCCFEFSAEIFYTGLHLHADAANDHASMAIAVKQ
jgi:hypothetical protein